MKHTLLLVLVSTVLSNTCLVGIHGFGSNCKVLLGAIQEAADEAGMEAHCANQYSKLKSKTNSVKFQAEEAYQYIKTTGCQNVYLIAISQGAVMANYIVGRNDNSDFKIKGLSTFAGVNRGIHSIAGHYQNILLGFLKPILNAPTSYKRSDDPKKFRKSKVFIKKVINEEEENNQSIKEKFLALDKILLIGQENENLLRPKETVYFLWSDKKGNELAYDEDLFFNDDRLGVLEMFSKGKLGVFEIGREHGDIDPKEVVKAVKAMTSRTPFKRENFNESSTREELFEAYKQAVQAKKPITYLSSGKKEDSIKDISNRLRRLKSSGSIKGPSPSFRQPKRPSE